MIRALLAVLMFSSLCFSAGDTLTDTVYATLNWHNQPTSISVDWNTGNLTAIFPTPIMQALPYDSTHGIGINIYGANNIWYDSLQQQDSVSFPKKTMSCDAVWDSVAFHCKRYFKHKVKTTQQE